MDQTVTDAEVSSQVAGLEARVRELEAEALTLRSQNEGLKAADAQRSRWIAQLNEDACDWADAHGLCSVFEEFCDLHDLEGRRRDYDVEIEVTLSLTMTLSDLRRGMSDSDLEDLVRNQFTDEQLIDELYERRAQVSVDRLDVEEA
ncbi:hypothetical protein TSHO111613_24705 [Tsukamurella hominis]